MGNKLPLLRSNEILIMTRDLLTSYLLYDNIKTHYTPPHNDETTISMDILGVAVQKGFPLKGQLEKQ